MCGEPFRYFVDRFHLQAHLAQPNRLFRAWRRSETPDLQNRARVSRSRLCRNRLRSKTPRQTAAGAFPPPSAALANACPKLDACPITSPVLRISGPRRIGAPSSLSNGRTTSLTKNPSTRGSVNKPISRQVFPAADLRGDARERHVDRFAHEWHGAARAWIHFEHVHDFIFDRELRVHQSAHAERQGDPRRHSRG